MTVEIFARSAILQSHKDVVVFLKGILQMPDIKSKTLPLSLYPLIATQGLYVRYRAARLAEAAGPRAGLAGSGPHLRLLIVGDSSAAGVGVATQSDALAGQLVGRLAPHFTLDWQLVARCGDTTRASLSRLAALPDQRFDVALTALGVNDVKNGRTRSAWQRDSTALHSALVDRFGVRLVIASGIPPLQDLPLLPDPLRGVLARRGRQFDAILGRVCAARPQAHHLPADLPLLPEWMAEDGFHPKKPVYSEWARRAAKVVLTTFGARNP